jgi:hypothetical protein
MWQDSGTPELKSMQQVQQHHWIFLQQSFAFLLKIILRCGSVA